MKGKGRILVTGGSGFVGSHLIAELERRGYPAKGVCFRNGRAETLRTFNPELIVHLAANTDPDRRPGLIRRMMKENFNTALDLFLAALKLKKLKGIIVFGSAGEYELGPVPFVETFREMPASPYSFSKVCVTHLASYFHRVHGLPVVIVRPSVLYGEGQVNNQFVPSFIRQCLKNKTVAMTGGEQAKDFLYIRDLMDAICRLIRRLENGQSASLAGQILNICSGRTITMREIGDQIREETGSKSEIRMGAVPYRTGEKRVFCGSNRKAKRLLGWSPRYSFQDGLRNTIRWHRERMK